MPTRRAGWLAALLALVLVVGVPLVFTSRYEINLVILAAAWSIAALGLTVLLGYTGQISLAQATFYGVGAYAVALGTARWGLDWWTAMPVGLAAAALAGVVLGMTTLKVGGHYLAMVTISFQIIFSLVAVNWVGLTGGPDGVSGIRRPTGLPLRSAQQYAWFALAALWIVAVGVWYLKDTALGRAMRAVRENELAAEALGVDTLRTKVTAFALSGIIAALAGAVYASGFRYISPDTFSLDHSIEFLAMALAGGSDSVPGTIIGAIALTLLPEKLRDTGLGSAYLAIYGAVIILIIVFVPEGFWGLVRLATGRFVRPRPLPAARRPLAIRPRGTDGEPMLVVQGLVKHFGGLRAVDGVDLTVRRGEIHALIGPNGSGKTTCINLISGLYVPTAGTITFLGRPIQGMRPNRIARHGMARTFQNLRLFRELTVWENVLVGAQRSRGGEAETRERALAAIEFVGIADRAHERCRNLPYGTQKLVEIARAVASEPELLLLDEPAAGLNQTEKRNLVALLARLHAQGLTMLLVEHDMSLVSELSKAITVLNFGKKISEGDPDQVLADPVVVEAYLGNRDAALGLASRHA
ncbi:MAG TPA: branched-chain amino acid ABC transporter ATP-binding protein/permease [Thermodesulfobacteriota bacterium]